MSLARLGPGRMQASPDTGQEGSSKWLVPPRLRERGLVRRWNSKWNPKKLPCPVVVAVLTFDRSMMNARIGFEMDGRVFGWFDEMHHDGTTGRSTRSRPPQSR